MNLGPDHDALQLHYTDARQRIRFASASELYRVRMVHADDAGNGRQRRPFAALAVTITVMGDASAIAGQREGSAPLGLTYRYMPLEARGRPVSLPEDESIIRHISEGRGVLVRIPGGYSLRV